VVQRFQAGQLLVCELDLRGSGPVRAGERVSAPGRDVIGVLHADHRRDCLGLGEMLGGDARKTEVADQPSVG
jgi:hypothetical protein